MALHNRTRFCTVSLITFLLSISSPVMASPPSTESRDADDLSVVTLDDGSSQSGENYRQLAQAVPGMETLDPSRGSVGGDQDMGVWGTSNGGGERSSSVYKIHQPKKSQSLVPYYKYFTAGSLSRVTPVGTLKEVVSGKTKVSTTDWVYIDIGSSQNVKVGDLFVVYSHDEMIEHPLGEWQGEVKDREFDEDTSEYNGVLVNNPSAIDDDDIWPMMQINGSVVVREVSSNMAKAQVHESFNLMSKGDFLMPYPRDRKTMISRSYVPPQKNLKGRIAAIKDDNIMSATNDIIYLDKGSVDGVRDGDRLEVYIIPQSVDEDVDSRKYLRYPIPSRDVTPTMPHVIGELVVIDTLPETSTALILNSRDPIVAGQKFRSPR